MASDKKSVKKQKGKALSSFLVIAALVAVGGTGRFLWNYQSRLDAGGPASANAALPPVPEPEGAADPNSSNLLRAINELQAAKVANAPRPTAEPTEPMPAVPIVSKPVRGGIQIVGKNGVASGVAPPTREDLATLDQNSRYYSPPPRDTNDGPRIYVPDDPNRYLPQGPWRSGRPRYYDYDSGRSRPSYDSSYQRRTTVRSNTTTTGN